MKTDDLITALAAGVEPVRPAGLVRGLAVWTLAGTALALAALVLLLGLRPDLGVAVAGPVFWIKAAYTSALAIGGGWLFVQLGRPGASARAPLGLLAVVAGVIVLAATIEILALPAEARLSAWLGQSAVACPVSILLLAGFAAPAVFWAARRFAPVRPRLAGAAAGLLYGGAAATVYGLHCPESTLAFLATWYTLGIAAGALIGWLAGGRLLRW